MLELAPHVFLVPGENGSRFPYSSSLYLSGDRLRVLIDAGAGPAAMAEARRRGVDVLVLSHCHLDHRYSIGELGDVPVWAHELEKPYIEDNVLLLQNEGIHRSGYGLERFLAEMPEHFEARPCRLIEDGERIDLGGLTLVAVHTPGHTPGHLSFHIPEVDLLFGSDIDLSAFGPYYGHDFSDLEDTIDSIRKLKRIGANRAASSHAGPFEGDISERLEAYEQVIHHRERKLLALLERPSPVDDLLDRGLIYSSYPEPRQIIRYFERVHIEKHLERLARSGRVHNGDGLWRLTKKAV